MFPKKLNPTQDDFSVKIEWQAIGATLVDHVQGLDRIPGSLPGFPCQAKHYVRFGRWKINQISDASQPKLACI